MTFITFVICLSAFCWQFMECSKIKTEAPPLHHTRNQSIFSEAPSTVPPEPNCQCNKELPCGLPIIIVNETVFFVSYSPATYFDSMTFCCEHGMSLVNIKGQRENNVIKNLIASHPDKHALWTSGNRLSDGKTFIWGDGTPVTYTNWWKGEPNNAKKQEECIVVYSTAVGTGTWNDSNCINKYSFICEKPLYEC